MVHAISLNFNVDHTFKLVDDVLHLCKRMLIAMIRRLNYVVPGEWGHLLLFVFDTFTLKIKFKKR